MKHLPSPTVAERNQQRKLAFLPPVWPLLAIAAIVAVIVIATR
jgi:hypothetical protein